MTIKVRIDPQQMKKVREAGERALTETAKIIADDIALQQVVPKDTGMLQSSVSINKISPTKQVISYNTPYARRLYFHPEYNFRRDKNQFAMGRWMDSYFDPGSEDYNFVVDTFKNEFEKELKKEGVLK